MGFFDPEETSSPQHGIYVVYLFAENLGTVALTLNQGIEDLRKSLGDRRARDKLAAEAGAIRSSIRQELLVGLEFDLDLKSTGQRQVGYEAGNIAAITYDLSQLPEEETLLADPRRFLNLYQEAVAVKRTILVTEPGTLASRGTAPP